MLSAEDNTLLTQSEAGTPMGELLRRFWLPVLLCEELPEPDCIPMRVTVMGEELIAFRDTAAASALIDATARTAAPPCSSAATRKTASAASTTAGSSTSTASCVDMPNVPET